MNGKAEQTCREYSQIDDKRCNRFRSEPGDIRRGKTTEQPHDGGRWTMFPGQDERQYGDGDNAHQRCGQSEQPV